MIERLFMGVDIGTSGVRAAIFNTEGNQISLCYKEYPIICNEHRMAELDPELIFSLLISVVRDCIKKNNTPANYIEAIGLCSQMHSLMAVNKEGKCLTNVITWADSRSIDESDFIEKNYDLKGMYERTGCRVQHPMYPLSKILWIKYSKPEIYSNVYKFLTIKGYILYKLFGKFLIDITDASATGCFNIHEFKWDDYILQDVLNIGTGMFCEPVECTYILKGIEKVYAEEMGLSPETPVIIGSGDGIMANLGCGVFDDTSMSCTIGTSGALRISVDKTLLDLHQRTWCYCFTKDKWVSGGAVNNGGIVLKWFRDQYQKQFEYEADILGLKDLYELFDHYVMQVEPGCGGLIFLPYLTGERSPGWNANASGLIYGLRLTHDKRHMVRAAMEGIICNMYSIYEIIEKLDGNVKTIVANGGYVNSNAWLQIQADIFNKDIAVAGVAEASAFGAAYIAMAAVGAIKNLQTLLPKMKPVKVVKPIMENVEAYRKTYKQFRDLYDKNIGAN